MLWDRGAVCAVGAMCVIGLSQASAADVSPMPTKAAVQSSDQTWSASYNSELRYYTWRNTLGNPTGGVPGQPGRGWQFYAPMSLSVSGAPNSDWKVELLARAGYVAAEQRTAGEHGSVSTPTDSQLSGTVTYNGINGFQPFVAMIVNLPTGKSALYGSSRFARMDPDLVEIGSYGEGWNLGPTAGVNIPITPSLMATLSAGYTSRGTFNKEGTDPLTGQLTATDRVKNGDDATLTFALGYSGGPLSMQGSVSHAWNGISQVNDFGQTDFQRYRAGPRTTVTGSAGYQFNEQWKATVDGFWTHSDRNEVLGAVGPTLFPEAFNSNSDVFRINAGLSYLTAMGVSVGPTASYLYRNHNAFNPATFGFVPAKTRWSVGGVASYNVTNMINVNGRLERVWVRENINPGSGIVDQSGDAWVLALGATINFQP